MAVAKFSILFTIFIGFVVFQLQQSLCIKQSYIVYLGAHSHNRDVNTTKTPVSLRRVTDSHTQLLASYLGSDEKAKDAIYYSYKRHINGFAALLEDEEASQIAKHKDVVSVLLNHGRKLHTTHSWDFLMLEKNGVIKHQSAWNKARFGQHTIIANLDTGVWPESESFSDKGYGPIPSKWKGICQVNNKTQHFCNRKLIGARYFNKGYESSIGKLNSSFQSPLDTDGHGSHTLSTASGTFVPRASVFGVGNGTAKGGSPFARAVAYKVCWPPVNGSECFDSDILKAFDNAIHDGVDVLSVSLGGYPFDYLNDGIAIGSFHAIKHGIVVVASAGNAGPVSGSVSNVAPWMFTVGASTIDRELQANVVLKNGSFFKGTSISKPLPHGGFYPIISGKDARVANVSAVDAILCKLNTLDPNKVKDKIVVCLRGINDRVEKGVEAARAGAAAMILANDESTGNEIIGDPHVLPASHINYTDGLTLFAYMNSTKHPEGFITTPKAVLNVKPAPFMASFSSRGPNVITPQILKPDVTAPGVNIIAAYSEGVSATGLSYDKRTTPFNILSGTSMSCPHVSGLVGLLKSSHPKWSPAAIKSAIMTTARTRDNTENPMHDSDGTEATPFAYGSGDIRPNHALDPGLVYDLSVGDYLDFLCNHGYNETLISRFSGSNHVCPENYDLNDFNYPSISVTPIDETTIVTRKVTNVGEPGTYSARVRQPRDYLVTVRPSVLSFKKIGEKKKFEVIIKATKPKSEMEVDYRFGQLTWSDGRHYVRSPIVVLP